VSSFPHYVERFRRRGLDAEYLSIAFYARVLDRLKERGLDPDSTSERRYLLTFVGGLSPRVYDRGTRLLETVAGELDVAVWGYDEPELPADSPILRHYHGHAWGIEMYEILAQSCITINRHGEVAEGYANNMRLFEATGVGAALATEAQANLSALYEPERELIAYEDAYDLIEKIRHYLEHDEQRLAIARAGQARTFEEHTYAARIPRLAEMLEARLGKRTRRSATSGLTRVES